MRQCSSRYAIHAGRNLPDKELRYLRTVIVTAAVYRGFGRELSPSSLTYRHRAGVSLYTSTYVFAETCVFDKQSLEPIYCGLPELAPQKAPLIANLRGHFAEFLNHRSLERLRLLVSPTCVSFSTVTSFQSLGAFLGRASDHFPNIYAVGPLRWRMGRIFLSPTSEGSTDISSRTADPTRAVPPSVHDSGAGILTCSPSSTPFGLD